jgi:hypothetical protein
LIEERYREYESKVRRVLDPTGRRTAKLCVTPFVYGRDLWNEMDRLARSYATLLEFVFQEFPRNRRIQDVLEYPPELERFLGALNVYPRNLAAARIDVFLTGQGLRMVESNTEIPGGNEESYFLEQEYLTTLRPEGLAAVPRMEIVYDMLLAYYRVQAEAKGLDPDKRLNIYLAQRQSEIDRILGEYEILIDYVRSRGHACEVIDPTRIRIEDNRAWAPSGERIDLIYRRFTSDELPIVSDRGWQLALDWDRADVVVVNPFCTKRVDSKNIMVLFGDEAYDDLFPPSLAADLATVRSVIPWTRKIKDDLVLTDGTEVDARSYLLDAKDTLVIKHANAYSSAAVFIGEDVPADRWSEVVGRSLEGDWIVQERIDLPEIDLEYWEDDRLHTACCIYNVNPYIYDGKLGGFLNRASTDKLTAFKPGSVATVMPCFERVAGDGEAVPD